MAGISSKSLNVGGNDNNCGCPNKKGFNGNELQSKEFSDGRGLELYDFNARTFDTQIGRFIQIDPLIESGEQESLTPYHFGKNDPIRYNDPDGKCPSCVIGAAIGFVVDATIQVASSVAKSYANGESVTLGTIWRDYDGKQALAATGAGFITGGVSAYEQGSAAVVKTAIVNGSFSAAGQLASNGKIDPIKTAIDAAPIPELKRQTIINTRSAEKAVSRAENSINSSTGRSIPERKLNQLDNAKEKLNNQNKVNEVYNSAASSTREGVSKAIVTPIANLQPQNNTPVNRQLIDTRTGVDNVRIPNQIPRQ